MIVKYGQRGTGSTHPVETAPKARSGVRENCRIRCYGYSYELVGKLRALKRWREIPRRLIYLLLLYLPLQPPLLLLQPLQFHVGHHLLVLSSLGSLLRLVTSFFCCLISLMCCSTSIRHLA